jgi:hypothetical protein
MGGGPPGDIRGWSDRGIDVLERIIIPGIDKVFIIPICRTIYRIDHYPRIDIHRESGIMAIK